MSARSRSEFATDKLRSAAAAECGHSSLELIASADDVAAEIKLRREFFLPRLEGEIDERDLRDLTEMTTNEAEPIYACACDLLVRADPMRTPQRFARDEYDEATLEKLYTLHVDTFVAKTSIRDLLPRGARVLEIGSYAGGFLEAARRWGWKAIGLDIGRDTAAFAAAKGYEVTSERFERSDFSSESFDGVFIWSCFEQMPNPTEVLERVRTIAKRGAPLVLYVPDGSVYRGAQRAFRDGEPREPSSPVVQQLAYNNLLGFPHHFGYDESSLSRLLTNCGITIESVKSVPAIRPLRERLTPCAKEEEARVEPAWLEVVSRIGRGERI